MQQQQEKSDYLRSCVGRSRVSICEYHYRKTEDIIHKHAFRANL